ncbi:MAG: HAMP domain-containing histidine kinase [Myxococcaceae bacterium]|nr:HAMP domain-containing histidine kinase [Myxococcaceae bacterium]
MGGRFDDVLAAALVLGQGRRAALVLSDGTSQTTGFEAPPALDALRVTRPAFVDGELVAVPAGRVGTLAVWRADGGAAPPALEALGRLVGRALECEGEAATLRRSVERADRLAMVGQLAAGLAHELGTPLTVVSGRARQLAAGAIAPAQAPEVARTIAEQAERMSAIIRQVLDYARRRGPKPGRYDVRTVMLQAVGLLGPVAARKQVALSFADPGTPRLVTFDGSQVLQVMTNLVANAIGATPPGGTVALSLAEAPGHQPPPDTGLSRRDFVALRVQDTGVGIATEHLQRVFEPFFTTKETGEGTGLGLSVSLGIIRDHDGWIEVQTTRGAGTCFIVYLPA